MKNKIIIIISLILVLANLVSCSNGNGESFAITTIETKNAETTSSKQGDVTPDNTYFDNEQIKIGSYIFLTYSREFCDIEYSFEKGLGVNETVYVKIKMKDGYQFTCFTQDDYLPNLKEEELVDKVITYEESFEISVNKETYIFANYSMIITYDGNGGHALLSSSDPSMVKQHYPVSYYKSPKATNYWAFFRGGYTLIGFSETKDGENIISVGSRFTPKSSTPTLYCIWAKEESLSNFDLKVIGNEVHIISYKGNSEELVIPNATEDGVITCIEEGAINSENIKTIILPPTIRSLKKSSINCENLESLIVYDSITEIEQDLVSTNPKLKNLRINTQYASYDNWGMGIYNKFDRLVWAKDKKKIVIYGGSGTWYGFDCEQLTKEFGDEYVIINMGMNANICSSVVIEGISKYMNEDDIFIWSPEPIENVLESTVFDERTWWFTFNHFDMYTGIDISKYKNVFTTFAKFNLEHQKHQIGDSASDINENIYGDNVTKRENIVAFVQYNEYYEVKNAYVQSVFENMKNNGVKLLLTYAAMAKDQPGTDEKTLEYNEKCLKNSFKDFVFISDYSSCLYDISLFYNSEWHMTNEGAKIRTENVIKDLKKYFENE